MDVMTRSDCYSMEKDRQWFVEAVRYAIERQNLRRDRIEKISEACLYEIKCPKHPFDNAGKAYFECPPADAIDPIYLIPENHDSINK